MKKLLHIIASPRQEESRTLKVSEAFLESFREKNPHYVIDELNLSKEKLPSLSMKRVDGKYLLLGGKDLYGDFKDAWEEVLLAIQRFLSADVYLISSPMWNFHIPYMLKQYIDLIVQPKYLFRYTEQGTVEGLAKNKKMLIVTTRGGNYSLPQTKDLDFQEPYLRMIFNYVGITDITFIKAEPMDMGREMQEQKLNEAIESAKKEGMSAKYA
jgi:FMN-dependent NADH-azoreductase